MKRTNGIWRTAALWAAALAACAAAGTARGASGTPEIVDGVEWRYTVGGDGLATVVQVESNALAGHVTVPATLGGSPVGYIHMLAFDHCDKMTGVTLPDTLLAIDESSFQGCSALQSVTIPASVRELDRHPFPGCTSLATLRVAEDNPHFTARDNVVYSKDMTRLAFAAPGADLGDFAIPGTVTNIGIWAFNRCVHLRSVSVPSGVRQIGSWTFAYCPELTSVKLSEGLETIDKGGFGYSALTNLSLPASLYWLSPEAVAGCTNLVAYSVAGGNWTYAARDGILFSKDMKTLALYPSGRTNAVFAVPAGVEALGDWAFQGCPRLEELEIPEGVSSLGFSSVGSCPKLARVKLPSSLRTIGSYCFRQNAALEELEIPEGVEYIADRAFYYCSALKWLSVPDSLASWEGTPVVDCKALDRAEVPEAWDGTDKPGSFGVNPWRWDRVAYRRREADATWKYSVRDGAAWVVGAETAAEALETPLVLGGHDVAGATNGAFAACGTLRRLYAPASWEGTAALADAGLPENCQVVYVEAAEQTLYWSPPASGLPGGHAVLAGSASGGGAVDFAVESGPAFVEGEVLTFTGPGTVRLRARQGGSVRWARVEEVREVEVAGRDSAGRRVCADVAANYTNGWYGGFLYNHGEGFGDWRIDKKEGMWGTGWAGYGIWDPSANGFAGTWGGKTRAFGLVGKGEGWSVAASRGFERALRPGDAFSLEMGVNWDSNQDGAKKGFVLTAGGADMVTVNHGSYPGNISLNGNDGHAALNAYGLHPMVWTFTAVDGKTLRVEATRRDGGGGVFSTVLAVSSSAIDGFRLQSGGQNPNDSGADGDKRQSYFDDFRLFLGEDAPATSGGVPHVWIDAHAAALLAELGGDYEAVAAATAANGRTVAECYAAGLEDLSSEEDFTVSIQLVDGEPRVAWHPDLNRGGTKQERIYTLYGTTNLLSDDPWTDVTGDPAPVSSGWRFFRATVALPE